MSERMRDPEEEYLASLIAFVRFGRDGVTAIQWERLIREARDRLQPMRMHSATIDTVSHDTDRAIQDTSKAQAAIQIEQALRALFPYSDPNDDPDRMRAADQVRIFHALSILTS